jgi:hypothetical protein
MRRSQTLSPLTFTTTPTPKEMKMITRKFFAALCLFGLLATGPAIYANDPQQPEAPVDAEDEQADMPVEVTGAF